MHSRTAKDPLVKFIDGWDTVPEMEAALGVPEGSLGRAMYAGFTVGGVVRVRRTSPTMARATHAAHLLGRVVPWPTCWRAGALRICCELKRDRRE
jgi:hypothetical protein